MKRPGAILVFGPPGTGKTTIAKSLLRELNRVLRTTPGEGTHEDWRFLALSPADFARDGKDRIIASAERLFRKLQRIRRCVVLLDEMEEFLRVRTPQSETDSRLITTAFLPLLQETVNRREIILIVATNFVGTIDPAVTRRGRFDLILPLGPPDRRSRETIVTLAEKEFRMSNPASQSIDLLEASTLESIVTYTMGYTRDELRDYLTELRLLEPRTAKNDLHTELWRIRQERVPMALSGNPGCNWRTFRDEANRFKRGINRAEQAEDETDPEQSGNGHGVGDSDYWDEPLMPVLDDLS